jgi:hypothetical protein
VHGAQGSAHLRIENRMKPSGVRLRAIGSWLVH